jgi:hypothetical protein
MIIAGLIFYYSFAVLLLVGVVYHARRQNSRDAEVAFAHLQSDIQIWQQTPPIPPILNALVENTCEGNFSSPERHEIRNAGVIGNLTDSLHSELTPREVE